MKPQWNREFEQACAERLVPLLVQRCGLAGKLRVWEVRVAADWKVKFHFVPLGEAVFYRGRSARYGRRPGLELDWQELCGDVDAWQMAGGVVSGVAHGWQIFKKWCTRNEERPSQLLAVVDRMALAELRAAFAAKGNDARG